MREKWPKMWDDFREWSHVDRSPDGARYSIYSMRHYYATQRRREGVDWVLLAQQMGHTSLEMLRSYYVHVQPRDDAHHILQRFWAGRVGR
jgi:integrase